MLRASLPLVALALTSQSGPSLAASIQPTGKWEVQYSDRACTAKRAFGDHVLAIRPSAIGKTVRFVVEAPGQANRVRQYGSVIDVQDGRPAIRASSMIYPLKAKKRRGLMTVVGPDEAARIQRDGRFSIWSGNKLAKQADGLPNSPRIMTADLAIGSTVALQKSLDKCIGDLQRHWGMIDGKLPETIKSAPSATNLPGLLKGSDYPVDSLVANQTGVTQALLMVDETGKVVDCVTTQSSGSAAIDAVVCQVMEERALFTPATDDQGKPRRGLAMTPPIRFVIAR